MTGGTPFSSVDVDYITRSNFDRGHSPILTGGTPFSSVDVIKFVFVNKQLIDFSQGELFETNSRELIVGIRATIGEGSGLEK